MEPAAVEKHGGKDGDDAPGHVSGRQIKKKISGHKAKDLDELLQLRPPHGHFQKKNQGIQDDKGVVEGGATDGGSAVSQRNHAGIRKFGSRII
jgi:hypothetical protein